MGIQGYWDYTRSVPWSYQDTNGYNLQGGKVVSFPQYRNAGRVPGWRQLIATQRSATGGLNVSLYDSYSYFQYDSEQFGDIRHGPLYKRVGQGPYRGSPQIGFPGYVDPGFAEAVQGAKLAWTRKLASKRSAVLAGVSAMEARESYAMIRDRTTQFGGYVTRYLDKTVKLRKQHRIKRGQPVRTLGKYLTAQNELYLEYSYGWAPLVGEVVAWSEEIAKNPFRGIKESENLMSKNTCRYTFSDTTPYESFSLVPHHWKREMSLTKETKYYGAWLLESAVSQRISGFGLSPHEFIPSLWELIPWSFVVDYVSTVGTVLQSLSLGQSRLAWSQTTEVTTRTVNYSGPVFLPYGIYKSAAEAQALMYGYPNYVLTLSGSASLSHFSCVRAPGTPTDMTPELELRIPNGHQSFNIGQLLAGRFRIFQKLL